MSDYGNLYLYLCNCAGPQPSSANPRADEHLPGCPYRARVEAETVTTTTTRKDSTDEHTTIREVSRE